MTIERITIVGTGLIGASTGLALRAAQFPGEIFGWESAVRHMKGQMKIAKKFQRINPSLEPAGFVAEQAGAGANDGKKLPGANRSRQFDLRRLSSGKRNQSEH